MTRYVTRLNTAFLTASDDLKKDFNDLRKDLDELATCTTENFETLNNHIEYISSDARLKFQLINRNFQEAENHLSAHDNQINLLATQTNEALNDISDTFTPEITELQKHYKKLQSQLNIQFVLIISLLIELIAVYWVLH